AGWGGLGSRQRGQVTSTGRDAFHWERRLRVLLRDIFRFGTATSILLGHPRAVAGGRLSGHPHARRGEGVPRTLVYRGTPLCAGQRSQRSPGFSAISRSASQRGSIRSPWP